jgi:hypothetical protein
MTALPAAVRARLPMVVFAGESPINAKVLQSAHRPGAAGDGDRGALHRRA